MSIRPSLETLKEVKKSPAWKRFKKVLNVKVASRTDEIKQAIFRKDTTLSKVIDSEITIQPKPLDQALKDLHVSLPRDSNILKLEYNTFKLTKDDITLLVPDIIYRKYKTDGSNSELVKSFVVARDPVTLQRLNHYYLIFESPEKAASFYLETINSEIGGTKVQFQFIDSSNINKEIKYLHLPILADLDMSNYIKNPVPMIQKYFKNELTTQLSHNETDSALVTIARQLWFDLKYQQSQMIEKEKKELKKGVKRLRPENFQATSEQAKYMEIADSKDSTFRFPNIPYASRDSIVILRYVPQRVDVREFRSQLWEYRIYPIEDIAFRKLKGTKSSTTNDWLILFADSREARKFVNNYNGRAVDENLPDIISTAEIMD